MDFSHFDHYDIIAPDGHDLGSADVGHDGMNILDPMGQNIAHSEQLAGLDQLLDSQGQEIASIDQHGTVWQDGHIIADIQHLPNSSDIAVTSADGHAIATEHAGPDGSITITSPAGAALMMLNQRFGV